MKLFRYITLALFVIQILVVFAPLASASTFNGYLETFYGNNPPAQTGYYTYTCRDASQVVQTTPNCAWTAGTGYMASNTCSCVGINSRFTLSGPTFGTVGWTLNYDYTIARTCTGSQTPHTTCAGGDFTSGIQNAGGNSLSANHNWECVAGPNCDFFRTVPNGGSCQTGTLTNDIADQSASRTGHIIYTYTYSSDTITMNDGINTCTNTMASLGYAAHALSSISLITFGSSGAGGAILSSRFTNMILNTNDGHTYVYRDGTVGTTQTGTMDKAYSDVKANFLEPTSVFAIEFGQSGSGYTDTGCNQAPNPCGTTARFDPILTLQAIGHACNPQTTSVAYVDLSSPIGYEQLITTANKYAIECSFSSPPGASTNPNGWGLGQINLGTPMGLADIWADPANQYRHVLRMDALNLNAVYALLDNGNIVKIDSYTNALTFEQRLLKTINIFPVNDIALSYSGNGKLAVVTGTGNQIIILDKDLNILSTTPTTGTPLGVAIYGNNLYTCDATQTHKYAINTDNSITLVKSVYSSCAAGAAQNGRVLRTTKDGQYLIYINQTGTTHDVELFNTTLMNTIFKSPQYGNVYSADVDVLNKKLYASVPDSNNQGQIDYYDISSLTWAWGAIGHNFPNGMNPYLNTTLYPGDTNGQSTNTTNPNGGTLGTYSCGAGSNSLFSNIVCNLAPLLPTGLEGAKWFFGIVVVVIVIIWLYRATESPVSILIGAFLGVGLAIGIGLLPIWFMMAIVFLLIILVGNMFFGGGDDT